MSVAEIAYLAALIGLTFAALCCVIGAYEDYQRRQARTFTAHRWSVRE